MQNLLEDLKYFRQFKCPAIYKITNIINDKIYIGKSINFFNRYKHHKYNTDIKTYIANAFTKYGFENFKFELIEFPDKDKLSEREQINLDLYKSYNKDIGYNIRKSVDDNTGFRHSEETKKKISLKCKGIKPWHAGKTNVKQLKDCWDSNRKEAHSKKMYGGNNPNAKPVLQYDLNGNFIAEFLSCREASDIVKVNPKSISRAALGGRKTAGNYIWKYK